MQKQPVYEALAEAFASEGVKMLFALMGDGNMHWVTAMQKLPGMDVVHVRHEHCACAMAMGYHSATGEVGVASVTHGPGLTQLMTVLKEAASVATPLVIFAGEVALSAKHHGQYIEQAPLTTAAEGHYIAAHSLARMHDYVRDAFYFARYRRRPVVLGVPYDIQKQAAPELGEYRPSASVIPKLGRMLPDSGQVAMVAERLSNARCPVLLTGRGAIWSDAQQPIEELADRCNAILSTTLPARGMFDHHPFSIGVSGGYARDIAMEVGANADLVVAFGASLSNHTTDGGSMYPKAEFVQVDPEPRGLYQGRRVADIYIQADAKATAAALLHQLTGTNTISSDIRSPELARRIQTEPADKSVYRIEPGKLDPRVVVEELDLVIPKDYDTVGGTGQQSYFYSVMRGRKPEHYHDIKGGAIGSALSRTVGVAVVRRNGKVVLFEGDGSLLMHIQELETIKRHGIKLLVCIFNDGAFGSEIHKMRAEGINASGAIFGRPDFASIARGFGLNGHTVTDITQLKPLFDAYCKQDTAEIWDIHISDQVMNPLIRRNNESRLGSKH